MITAQIDLLQDRLNSALSASMEDDVEEEEYEVKELARDSGGIER